MERLLQCRAPMFCCILAIYYTLVVNIPFLIKAFVYINSHGITLATLLLLISLPFCLFSMFYSFFSLLAFKYLEKPIFILLTCLAAILSYAYAYHGVVFDDFSPMMGTIEQSDWQEISPLITPSFVVWFCIAGIAPSWWIYKLKIIHQGWKQELLIKFISVLLYPLFYLVIIWPFMSLFQPVVHVTGLSARAPFQIIPNNFIENAYKHYREMISAQLPYSYVALDAKNESDPKAKKKNLLIIVIGEAARGKNYSLNGYTRLTNPFTPRQHVISLENVVSCDTATRVSVPCIFSGLTREQFSNIKANHRDNLLDILKRVNINLFWIDNNGAGGCQGVCKNIDSIITKSMDGELIPIMAEKISQFEGKDSVIVVHLQGSHGPSYYAKYSERFRKFTPDCRKDELRMCDQQALLNAYDNSLIYTDFVINEMIELLKSQSEQWDSALIYTSDHGESIGEKGLYGHCAPYWFAPMEQKQVPFLIWLSPDVVREDNLSLQCLMRKSKRMQFSHDNLFHSVLGILNIKTKAYDKNLDLFQSCREP